MSEDDRAARASLLQELTIEVGYATDARAVASAVVRLGRALLDAASGVVWTIDSDGALVLAASDGIPDAFLTRWQHVRPDDEDVPALQAVRAGHPLWVSSVEEYVRMSKAIAAQAQTANRPMAFAALPLAFEGRALGVIVFGFVAPHEFNDDEKRLVLAIAGHAAQALERARLQDAQVRALAGLRIVAKAGEMLAASLDVDATLTALAKAVVPDVADWCAVDLLADGNLRRLTAHHADPKKVELARDYAERFPARLDDPNSTIRRIVETGAPVWVRRITFEMLEQSISNPEQLAILRSLGLVSIVQAPLVSEGRVRGMVSFIMSESGREYDETDRDLLVEIGRRAGLAITNAELYAREQRARERITRLASVTAALARAPTTADVGMVACREGAAALGATTGALYSVDGDFLRLIAHSNYAAEYVAHFKEFPLDQDVPLTRVARTNEPVVIESAEQLREFSDVSEYWRERGRPQAFMCKPLSDRSGKVVGVLGFGFEGTRSFAEDERAFARTLADHCAQAFERARILDRERSARDRVALLAAAGETFSATIDYEETLKAVVRIALPALADFGFFDVVERSGEVRRTSGAHDDPEVAAILAQSRWIKSERTDVNLCALSTGQSAIHPNIDEAFLKEMATSAGHLAVLHALRLCSMITVPVVTRGQVIGALTLCHGRSGRHHTRDDLDSALELARRGAIAVEQARLYRASQDAARRAEEANRLKDDFLATVSHELRTPLNAIVGWSHLLDGERLADPAFVQRGLEVIRRNAYAQREIIDDILDVARIVTGKLRIDAMPVDVATVARDALEVVRAAADAKRVQLDARGLDVPAPIVGDAARLQQVIWNLLANAVKFTPSGGSVQLAVEAAGDHVVVRVTDDGIGIPGELLPFVFDRFRQADSSSTRAQGGLGLGLSIVRHLVELHGGTVTANSDGRGKGSTFEVVLPVNERAAARPASLSSPAAVSSAPAIGAAPGLRVLVVDDDDDSRELVSLILRSSKATVFVARDAREASAIFEREPVDVVLSDIAMPETDGYTLLGTLREIARERGRKLAVIALSAYGRTEDRVATARAGFVAHLTKPVEPAVLVDTVKRAGAV